MKRCFVPLASCRQIRTLNTGQERVHNRARSKAFVAFLFWFITLTCRLEASDTKYNVGFIFGE
jgi:hypothetical protein